MVLVLLCRGGRRRCGWWMWLQLTMVYLKASRRVNRHLKISVWVKSLHTRGIYFWILPDRRALGMISKLLPEGEGKRVKHTSSLNVYHKIFHEEKGSFSFWKKIHMYMPPPGGSFTLEQMISFLYFLKYFPYTTSFHELWAGS